MKRIIEKSTPQPMTKFGSCRLKLKTILDEKGITRNSLSEATGISYSVLDRYYKNELERIDLTLMAKMCYCLECDISDLVEYIEPDYEVC